MEDDDWLSAAVEDTPAEAPAEAAGAGDAPAGEEAAGDGGDLADELEELEDEGPRKARISDRPILFKYWKRPVTLQYAYLYDYRHNYYDDVIDYLDRRQRGLLRDVPRAQTWAERCLRTYNKNRVHSEDYYRKEKDISLLSEIRTSSRFYNYHSRGYFATKYSSIL